MLYETTGILEKRRDGPRNVSRRLDRGSAGFCNPFLRHWGQAVNAYVEPLVSLDLDLVVAKDRLGEAQSLLARHFRVERFPHSLNVSSPDSALRAQLQMDERYFPFIADAASHDVLGFELPVARVEDVLRGKVWAVTDASGRASKRQKDLADIARLIEAYPGLKHLVPLSVADRLTM